MGYNDCFIKGKCITTLYLTVHKYFHQVLNEMMEFAEETIVPKSVNQNSNILRR